MASRIGVYICHCGINIAATVDSEDVARYAARLPHVTVARDYMYMCSDPGQEMIKQDIRDYDLTGVVVASCSPRMHEVTFRAVAQEEGVNPYQFEMANIREQCSWVHADRTIATQKAKELVAGVVAKAVLLEPLEEREVDVTPAALVIGGGIAGLEAALDIADAGYQVYLVERQPSLGGRMAQLNKTPRMEDAGALVLGEASRALEHPQVTVLAYSEVTNVEGYVGNFQVTVRRQPRYVDPARCTACGQCAEACVLAGQVPDEFQAGLGRRAAIYRPFPRALPATYTVDPAHCRLLVAGVCESHTGDDGPPCAAACPERAVDFGQQAEEVTLDVGTIIVATGYDPFNAQRKPEFGYGRYPGVVTALEFERLAAPDGPTGGRIVIPGTDREPQHVAFIHCVGSRDKQLGNEYCSRVCCMYTAKQATVLRDLLPDARATVFYMDVRTFTKGGEEFYDQARARGVRYRRGNPSEIYKRGDRLVLRVEDTLLRQTVEVEADMVVLAVGLEPSAAGDPAAHLLKLARTGDGFLAEAHPKMRPVDTTSAGVFLAGTCQGPKDIPDTVAQAKAAASSALIPLSRGKARIEAIVSAIDPELCAGCGLCEASCAYNALSLHPWRGVMTINPVLCKGCGACAVACPSKAITLGHFTQKQTLAMLDAMLA
ncbi:MAG: CoB--CoM heterodisulfide reductase iron-sulfur subunit A family protein [Chloroflexi bacterium]|nr:CoB--CoM heterodisulfide reductase iron-sulfur subunit A family protein [Chloroflexota bacterium]MBU1749323.1 CoB--CoM heterodisulfide reductase iron-sulfur subunit A family protein [Chloroflexota bacterium]